MNKVSSTNSLSSLNLKIKRPLVATDDDRNNYRPMSLSESYVSQIQNENPEILSYYPKEILSINSPINSSNNLTENLIEQPTFPQQLEITTDERENIPFRIIYHTEDKIEIVINKLMLFFLHLFLISLFELIFFFGFVTKFENKAIIQLISEITNTAISSCNLLNTSDKQIIDYFLNRIVNSEQLLTNSNNAMTERNLYNK